MLEGFLKQACFQGMSHYSINSSWVEIDGRRAKWVKNGRKWPPFPSVKESLNKRLLKRLLQNDVLAQTAFWSHDTFITGGFSGFLPHPPKVSPSDRAGCLVVRLGGIHLNSPADWESEIMHTLSPYPYLCSTWEQPNRFDSKLLKITFLLYELRSSNFGRIPAFNIPIFISAVRKRNHGVSSAGTAARSCVH